MATGPEAEKQKTQEMQSFLVTSFISFGDFNTEECLPLVFEWAWVFLFYLFCSDTFNIVLQLVS